jgi:hypothetical protein
MIKNESIKKKRKSKKAINKAAISKKIKKNIRKTDVNVSRKIKNIIPVSSANIRKSSRVTADIGEVNRIKHEMAAAFFSDLIGQHMEIFVDALKQFIPRKKTGHSIYLDDFKIQQITHHSLFEINAKAPLIDNAIIPMSFQSNSSKEIQVVHWIFCVLKSSSRNKPQSQLNRSDFIVHDPYNYRMQKPGSHQFCQSHVLNLAYKYYTDQEIHSYSSEVEAYDDLLLFWKLLFGFEGIREKIDKLFHKVLDPIKKENSLIEKRFEKATEKMIREFPDNFDGVFEIMKSDYARNVFPNWA